MYLRAFAASLLLAATLCLTGFTQQERPGEERREQDADRIAYQNRGHEPHMSAALMHLRQAEEELERAAPNKGGHRERAMELTKQAQSQVEEGIRYYDQNPPGRR